jgi:hypothetical protein
MNTVATPRAAALASTEKRRGNRGALPAHLRASM